MKKHSKTEIFNQSTDSIIPHTPIQKRTILERVKQRKILAQNGKNRQKRSKTPNPRTFLDSFFPKTI